MTTTRKSATPERFPYPINMFPPVDTKNHEAVTAFVGGHYATLYPGASPVWLNRIMADVFALFSGRHPDYGPVDLRYHDLEHTLQATTCLAELLAGTRCHADAPALTPRQFQLGIAGVLLHDSGYLKLRSDTTGTGAKYTFCHVLRSCAFAASYLPTLGFNEVEIGGILGAISCTGPTKQIRHLRFRDDTERFIGCALATADYLGQMAASDYPDELEILYREFTESDEFCHVAPENRLFKSAADLIARTPAFWRSVVKPKLEQDFAGVCRFLATPPDGPNLYVEAVEHNIARIEARIAASPPTA